MFEIKINFHRFLNPERSMSVPERSSTLMERSCNQSGTMNGCNTERLGKFEYTNGRKCLFLNPNVLANDR